MSANENLYEYEALPSPTSVRLLRIFADHYDAPIRAQLEVARLEAKPSFSALSYVWGKEEAQHDLHLGDRILKIRKNLFNGIRRLRMRGTTNIWIDAVCMNQNDLEERAAQVMLMRQIYESARPVLVYLGEASESQQVFKLFESILRLVMPRPTGLTEENAKFHSTIDWCHLVQYGLPDARDAQWQYLIQLLENPWFSRVWVFQESLVARSCTFLYGDASIDSLKFFATLHIMGEFGFANYIDRSLRRGLSPVTSAIQRCSSILWLQKSPFADQTWSRSPLIQLIRDNASSDATDPRDYVFALLGVSNEAEEPDLRPNYLEPPENIFMRIGRYMVLNGYGPLLLNSASSSTRGLGMQKWSLPSWVPCWDTKDSFQVLRYIQGNIHVSNVFTAAGRTAQEFRVQEDRHTLTARGILLDTIEHVGTSQFVPKSIDAPVDEFKMTTTCLAEALKMLWSIKKPYPSGEPILEVLCRLLVCDRQRGDQEAPEGYQIGLKAFWGWQMGLCMMEPQRSDDDEYMRNLAELFYEIAKATPPPDEDKSWEWAEELHQVVWLQSRLSIRCLTQKGYVGQVLPNAKIGDRIAIIQGCEVPYLLRPSGNNQYSLISDCYLHGIMYGEAWDDKRVRDIEIV